MDDQEREDYADPPPPPSLWFESSTHPGTIAVVSVIVLMLAIYVLSGYAFRP
jgi:hypothetical protein